MVRQRRERGRGRSRARAPALDPPTSPSSRSLFDFVYPGKLGTLPVFTAEFALPIAAGGYAGATRAQARAAFRCAVVLRDLVAPYLLRRRKADVASQLPPKTERVLFCALAPAQRDAYRAFLASSDVADVLAGRRSALAGIDTLRKICNHPDLLQRTAWGDGGGYGDPVRSGKLTVALRVVAAWTAGGHRTLLFCQTRQMLDIVQGAMQEAGAAALRMDGETPVRARAALVDAFNAGALDPAASPPVFLLTTRVGGLGVNLTGADRVLLFDADWNPATDAQARERAWRLGQARPVVVYRLVAGGTIEEKVYHRQLFKQFVTDKARRGGGGSKGRTVRVQEERSTDRPPLPPSSVQVLTDPRQRRFFRQADLADLFTLAGPGGAAAAGGETARLLAAVPGADAVAAGAADVPVEDAAAVAAAGDGVTGVGVAPPDGADAPAAAGTADRPAGEASLLAELLDGGTVGGAVDHGAVEAASAPASARAEAAARRAAARAAAALAASAAEATTAPINVPTWTGRSGAPPPPRPRFGGGGAAGAGAPGSAALLARLRARAGGAPAAAAPPSPASPLDPAATDVADRLVRFLAAAGAAGVPSVAVVAACGGGGGPDDAPLFRAVLRGVAKLTSVPGGGGVKRWVLRPAFAEVVRARAEGGGGG